MRVAAIQLCSGANIEKNLTNTAGYIEAAAQAGAKLIVLPENFALLSRDEKAKVVAKETPGQGAIQGFLSKMAKQHRVWIVGGTMPMASANPDKVRAACLLFNDEGLCVARYDKLHLFDVTVTEQEKYAESAAIERGDKIVSADTPFAKIGFAVCYDVRFPELFRVLHTQGANLLVLPSAFTLTTGRAHWHVLVRARAIENLSFMIAAGQAGHHEAGRDTYGHSLIVDPWGNVLAEGDEKNPGFITADLDFSAQEKWRLTLPTSAHRRIIVPGNLD